MEEHPEYVAQNNAMGYLSDNGGESYNLCHCKFILPGSYTDSDSLDIVWSNFEIASLDFWRGEAYTKYFEYLDQTGGFYYEVRLSLKPSDLHTSF